MINALVEVVKNQKIVVDQIQNIINQFKNQKKMSTFKERLENEKKN